MPVIMRSVTRVVLTIAGVEAVNLPELVAVGVYFLYYV